MKSLAERLKEKEAREAKERLKRSGRVKTFSVKIPLCGCPSLITEGDTIYINQRARKVMKDIRSRSSWQFYQALKDAIAEIDKKREDEEKERRAFYSSLDSRPVDPAVPAAAPHPQPSPEMVPPSAVPTPSVPRLQSPGVSVREVDNTNVVVRGHRGNSSIT
jgi:hypothetical protein